MLSNKVLSLIKKRSLAPIYYYFIDNIFIPTFYIFAYSGEIDQ